MSCYEEHSPAVSNPSRPFAPADLELVDHLISQVQNALVMSSSATTPTTTNTMVNPSLLALLPQFNPLITNAIGNLLSTNTFDFRSTNQTNQTSTQIQVPIPIRPSIAIEPQLSPTSQMPSDVLTPTSLSTMPMLSPSHLSPIFPVVSGVDKSRRSSAPEAAQFMCAPGPSTSPGSRRRFSDFSVDSILRRENQDLLMAYPYHQQRRASNVSRKQRTIYGSRQTAILEMAFSSQKYMVGQEREQLARELNLSESQVRVWFQNRRSKQRKLSKQEGEAENKQ